MQTPIAFVAPENFDSAKSALARVRVIYDQSVTHLRLAM